MASQRLVPSLTSQSLRESIDVSTVGSVGPLTAPSYAPIGHGMLTGQIKSLDDIPQTDVRRKLPRFQPENFEANIKLVKELEKIAGKKQCTPAQLALAWLRSLSNKKGMPKIIPIPGATTAERVKENAVEVQLNEVEIKDIDTILASCTVVGDRYHPDGMKTVDG